jgi:hypothetical protein
MVDNMTFYRHPVRRVISKDISMFCVIDITIEGIRSQNNVIISFAA